MFPHFCVSFSIFGFWISGSLICSVPSRKLVLFTHFYFLIQVVIARSVWDRQNESENTVDCRLLFIQVFIGFHLFQGEQNKLLLSYIFRV